MTVDQLPRTALPAPPGYAGRWPPLREALVRNNGDTLTLADRTVVDAGDLAVVNLDDPVVAVEVLFGRLERNPVLTHLIPWPTHRDTGTSIHDVNVDDGVHL